MHGGVSGGEHRIHNDAATVLQFRRHTDQVLDRLLVFVAVETDMADTGGRHQSEETVRHAEAGAEHGNNHILLAGDHGGAHRSDRSFDTAGREGGVAGELIAHQHRDFLQKDTEILGRTRFFPHKGELMLHERMINNVKVGIAGIGFQGRLQIKTMINRVILIPCMNSESA